MIQGPKPKDQPPKREESQKYRRDKPRVIPQPWCEMLESLCLELMSWLAEMPALKSAFSCFLANSLIQKLNLTKSCARFWDMPGVNYADPACDGHKGCLALTKKATRDGWRLNNPFCRKGSGQPSRFQEALASRCQWAQLRVAMLSAHRPFHPAVASAAAKHANSWEKVGVFSFCFPCKQNNVLTTQCEGSFVIAAVYSKQTDVSHVFQGTVHELRTYNCYKGASAHASASTQSSNFPTNP